MTSLQSQATPGLARLEPHALRGLVMGEVHARPFRLIEGPRLFLHLGFDVSSKASSDRDRKLIEALCHAQGATPPGPEARHHVIAFSGGTLKWERFAEFATYSWDTVFDGRASGYSLLPPGQPFGTHFNQPGPLVVAIRLDFVPDESRGLQTETAGFDATSLCVAEVVDGRAIAATDFRADGDGKVRILVLDRGLAPNQAGALLQRLLELETYRIFALMGLPEAYRVAPNIRRIETELTDITAEIRATEGLEANRRLLGRLSRLTADLEAEDAASSYRFGASRAYERIVTSRLQAINEKPVAGFPTWSSFLSRRMDPAMRTIETLQERQGNLSRKLARAAQLLRTRVDIDVEQQNRELLSSMNQRAKLQLRLQQTVEGLSIAAVSYYVIGLFGYLFKAGKEAHLYPFDPSILTGIAVPIVVFGIALIVRNIRKHHAETDAKIDPEGPSAPDTNPKS